MRDTLRSFGDFWPYYLSEHGRQETRILHIAGTASALLCLTLAILYWRFDFLGLAIVLGYGFAWIGHFVFEGNGPATFEHPLWSLRGDLRLFRLWVTGSLREELRRNGFPG